MAKRIATAGLLGALLSVLGGPLQAQTDIATPGGGVLCCWGGSGTPTYGQTFRSGGDYLNSFSFWLRPFPTANGRAYVYEWSDALFRAVGTSLFTGDFTTGPSDPAFTEIRVQTGQLALDPAKVYVAFFSTAGISGTTGTTWSGSATPNEQGILVAADSYAGGRFVYNSSDEVSGFTDREWGSQYYSGGDLRFAMDFSNAAAPDPVGTVTPEPVSMALLGTGLAGVGVLKRRRRKATA